LAKEEQEVLNTAFANLEFETGKDVIIASSNESLEELATLLSKKNQWTILISGHTDNVGKPAANMTLSQKRAFALKAFLINQGVESKRIETEWFGQTKPIASNKTTEGRQKNRRVEMTIITGN
jgi:outer membrane protein OmpA-like peptidoglycan-associated protein